MSAGQQVLIQLCHTGWEVVSPCSPLKAAVHLFLAPPAAMKLVDKRHPGLQSTIQI